MKNRTLLAGMLFALALLTSPAGTRGVRADGAQDKAAEADADPAAGVRKRLGQLKAWLKELRAKPHAPAPGESVGLNPQPEPPGKARTGKVDSKGEEVGLNPQPEPPGSAPFILRKMRSSLASVRANFGKLSLGSADAAKLTLKLDEALAALDRYEKAGDQKAANGALDDFAHALDALSKLSGSYVK